MIDEDKANAEPAAAPLRILLVEDDEFDVAVFGRAFHRSEIPCEIVRCRSGEEALDGLRNAELELDLLVTDHQLPGQSGFDLCLELIERQPPFALVLLTGVGSEQMAIRALRAGINDYIVKDTSREYLELLPLVLPRVARRHRQRRHRMLAAQQRPTQDASHPPSSTSSVQTAWPDGYHLGLSACADVIKQRGGRIWVEDSADHPTLHFSVPLARGEVNYWTATGAEPDHEPTAAAATDPDREPSDTAPDSADEHSRHVLIVRPNPIIAFVARRTAERAGYRVAAVENGRKAIEALDREPFDLVLMALEMPELDGLETTRQIRRRESDESDRLTILALGTDADAVERGREAGMDGAIATPVSAQSVMAAIDRTP